MYKNIVVFEDEYAHNLNPLVWFRPVYDLRCGMMTPLERIRFFFPQADYFLSVRTLLEELVVENFNSKAVNSLPEEETLFLNGRLLLTEDFFEYLKTLKPGTAFTSDNQIAAALLSAAQVRKRKAAISNGTISTDFFDGLRRETAEPVMFSFPWNLIHLNGKMLRHDFSLITKQYKPDELQPQNYEGVYLINKENIFISKSASIKPCTVIDASYGPVYIDDDAIIYPNCTLEGPLYIGKDVMVKMQSKFYRDTSIGRTCKVGGEIERAIIHSYANKQHEGYIGHAYLSQWVNLGADTNNSDLKNTYHNVHVIHNGRKVDTGYVNVGLMMGDHSKASINTMFNTGTIVGVNSNIFGGGGFPPKAVPSFSWYDGKSFDTYDPERGLVVAKSVMERRGVPLTTAYEKVYRAVFNKTADERKM